MGKPSSGNIGKIAVALVLGAMLSTVAAPGLRADDERSKCQHRIAKAEDKLDDAVRHHGAHSRQAEDRRRELVEERERCWNEYHSWWNGHERRWHGDRDWDRDWDHDRDHDHDHDDHH